MKKVTAILLSSIFLFNCIMMPFDNFQDTVSIKSLFNYFLQKDGDADVFEFIANDMLNMGSLLEEDEQEIPDQHQQPQHPLQPIQITQGFLYCTQPILIEERETPPTSRVFCYFLMHSYHFQFTSSIFHPPSFAS